METKQKKSALLLAASLVGFVSWIVLIVVIVRLSGVSEPVEPAQVGFFEGIKSLAKFIVSGSKESLWIIAAILWLLALAASPVLSLVAWLKDTKIPAYLAAVLYLPSLNLISTLLCLIGAKSFLEGRKTLLFIAGYTGILNIALMALMCAANAGDTILVVFAIISFLALMLNAAGWLKNNAKLTLAAAIAYILSVSGIISAVLCFIGRAQLKKQSKQV